MVDPWTLLAAVICGAICVRIVSYRRAGARYRVAVSLLAYVLAAATGCYSLSITLTALYGKHAAPVSPFLLVILLVVLVLVYRARGNVATVMRLDWSEVWDGRDRRVERR